MPLLTIPKILTLVLFTTTTLSLPTSSIQTSQFTPFNLVTAVTQGNASYSGLYITGQHTGAGLQAAVAVAEETSGLNFTEGGFVLNDTYIDLHFQPSSNLPIYSLGLDLGGSPLIVNVSGTTNQATNLDGIAGQQTAGFVIDQGGYICYGGSELPFETFTLCGGYTLFDPDGPDVEFQLLWRNTTSTPDLVRCADVRLEVRFP